MDVTCQSCRATYKVDDSKIPPNGIKAKCPKCGHSFLLKKPDDDVIAVGGDSAPPPANDPFAGFGAPPVPDLGAAPAPANPFGGAAADPFAGGFAAPAPAPASDPFAGGFGGGGFGSGGFDNPAPGGGGPPDIGGLFNAKTAFEIKRPTGEQVGPFDLFTIKQMIYEGQLNGSEMLLDAAGNWVPIGTVEDLGEILRLTGAQASSDGGGSAGSQWGGQPEKPAGWQKMEQPAAAPAMPAGGAAPVAPPTPIMAKPTGGGRAQPAAVAEKPAPPVALDKGRSRGIGERAIILIEGVWSLTRSRGGRIFLAVFFVVVVLGGLGYTFRETLLRVVGLSGKFEATRLIGEGDKTIGSGERGPMAAALARYGEALAAHPKSAEAQARIAEMSAVFWYLDPPRLDMKAKAEQSLAQALAGDGESYSVLRAQARLALAARDLGAAEAALGKAGAMPEAAADPVLVALKGDLLYEKGDVAGAEAAYQAAKANPSVAARSALGLARLKLRAGQYDAAKAAIDEAAKAEPDNGGVMALAAYLSARNGGDVAAARKSLREIAGSSHRFGMERSRASYYLGLLSEEAGQTAPALYHMSNAVRHNPSDPEALAAAKRLFQARFPDRSVDAWIAGIAKVRGSTAMEKVQTGSIEFEKRNLPGALSPLLAAVQEDTASARPQYELGRLLVEVSEAEKQKSKGHFERAMSIDAEWAEPVIALSRWELDAKQVKEARAHGEKAVALDPTLPDAYRVAAAATLAEKDYAAAEQQLLLATEFDPEDYKSWLDLGEARRLGGRAQEAIPAVETAEKLRPELAEPKVRLGAAYEALDDLAKASSYFAEAAKIEPANLEVATRLGVVEARQGNHLEARKRLEGVVKAQSSNGEAQYWLGSAFQSLGEPEKALEAYRAAVKANYFDKYLAHWHIGEILGSAGAVRDVDAAQQQLNICLELKPEHFPCLEEQAKILREENKPDDAMKVLKKVELAIAKLPPAKKDPVVIRVTMAQAKIARNQGKAKEAENLFRGILNKKPPAIVAAEVYWNLGQLVTEIDTRKAKALYAQAIRANAAYPPPYRDIAYILLEDGNNCAAKASLEKFVELTPIEAERKSVKEEADGIVCSR